MSTMSAATTERAVIEPQPRRRPRNAAGSGPLPMWASAVLPVILLVTWEVLGRLAGNVFFPPLSKVLMVFVEDWFPDVVLGDVAPSLVRFAIGFVIGAGAAIPIGLAIGMSSKLAEYVTPVLEFMRALPAVAILPAMMLLFGLGDSMRIGVIVFGTFFPVLVSAIAGAKAVRPERVDTARMFGISRSGIVTRVVLPSAMPTISSGLRVALPIALIMTVVSELVGGQNGIGFYLSLNQQLFKIPSMFAALIALGIIGNLINVAYMSVERRLLHWARYA